MRNVCRSIGLLALCIALFSADCAFAQMPVRKDETQQVQQQTKQMLKLLEEIKEVIVEVENATKAPRYDAPGYGTPGTAVPSQLAIDLASMTQQFCCCVQCLIDPHFDVIESDLDQIEDSLGSKTDVIDCDYVDNLNLCGDINNQEYSVQQWLKAIFYILNHIPTP